MREARMLGNYVQQLAERKGLSISDLGEILNCNERQVWAFLKGRAYASFSQISELSQKLEVSVQNLLVGDELTYNATVVHCMNQFQDAEKRETILDIIDNYLDIFDAVHAQQ